MVILRGCARCGGDIVTGDAKNVRCLQCGQKPEMPIAELTRRRRRARPDVQAAPISIDEIFATDRVSGDSAEDVPHARTHGSGALCPRCEETDAIALEKLRPHFNTCYRCRLCGHIFSPAAFKAAS